MLTYAGLLLPVALVDSAGNAQPRLVAQVRNLDGTAADVYADPDRTPLTGAVASDDAGNLQGFYAEPGVYLITFSLFGEDYTAHTLAAIDPRELTEAQAAALAAVAGENTRALTAEGLLQAAVAAEAARAAAAEAGLLPKTGGALTGDLAAANHRITGLADPASAQDAATRAYVLAVRDALVGGAPGLLDTLAEIDAQLASDETVAAALAATVALKAPLASPALTGTPTVNGQPVETTTHAAAAYRTVSSAKQTITYNADGTVATVTETDTGAVTTYTYNADLSPATESRLLSGVTTLRTFTYVSGNLTAVA